MKKLSSTQQKLIAEAIAEHGDFLPNETSQTQAFWNANLKTILSLVKLGLAAYNETEKYYYLLPAAFDLGIEPAIRAHSAHACPKCGGTGFIREYAFNGGICFRCNGTGKG